MTEYATWRFTAPGQDGPNLPPAADLFDAFAAATEPVLYRMRVGVGYIANDSRDATDMLRAFARSCARDVVHLWNAPAIVCAWLDSGAEELRDAASDAAAGIAFWSAGAAGAAAEAAAGFAVWAGAAAAIEAIDAAWAAARAAVWAAGWAAVRGAPEYAAETVVAAARATRAAQRARFAGMVADLFEENPT